MVQINAATATATPKTDIIEIALIVLCVFFENRYRLAMCKGRFTYQLFF
jgi:hypothetical protein